MRVIAEHHVTAVALMLAAVAGYVDGLGFLLLSGIFTSHMTGNTAHAGNAFANSDWGSVIRFGWTIVTFIAGLFSSSAITAIGKKHGFHSTFGIVLGIEAMLLLASAGIRNHFAVTAAMAGAMGLQTLTVTTVRGLRIYTTYMTGNLAKFAEGAVHFLVYGKPVELRHSIVTGMLWVFFLAGVATGCAAYREWSRAGIIAPAAVVAVLAIIDFRRPIDPADELPKPGGSGLR